MLIAAAKHSHAGMELHTRESYGPSALSLSGRMRMRLLSRLTGPISKKLREWPERNGGLDHGN